MAETVVRHRPFWSFFVIRIERWLGRMSLSGLNLCGLNFRGAFRFNAGKPQKCRYCFIYTKFECQKCGTKKNGRDWEKVAQRDRWCLYKSVKDNREGYVPNRRGLYLRNNSLLCLYAFLSSIVLLAAFGMVFWLYEFFWSQSATNDDFFRRAIVIVGAFALLLLGNFVFFLFMVSANNRILEMPEETEAPENAYRQFLKHKTFEKWLEKLLIKDGDISKKIHPVLLMSPRGLENWLSRMEKRGFNVYKVHKSGTVFYFIKGAPRNVKYCVMNSEGGNVSQYIKAGWQVVYSTGGWLSRFGRIAVLSQAYENEPVLPFKSDKDYVYNAARILLKYVIIYFLALVFMIGLLFVLVYFKAAVVISLVAGILAVIITLLIVKMLICFAKSVMIARKGLFKPHPPTSH